MRIPISVQNTILVFLLCSQIGSIAYAQQLESPLEHRDTPETQSIEPNRGSEIQRTNEQKRLQPQSLQTPEELSDLQLEQAKNSLEIKPADLIIGGEKLFTISSRIGSFSPTARVDAIERRVREITSVHGFDPNTIKAVDGRSYSDIECGDTIIMSVSDADARLARAASRSVLAQTYAGRLRNALIELHKQYSVKSILLGLFYSIVSILTLFVLMALTGALFRKLSSTLQGWRGRYIRSLKFQKSTLLSEDAITEVALGLVLLLRVVTTVSLMLICGTLVLSFFPTTRPFSGQLIAYFVSPLTQVIGPALAAYLPNLAFIAIIVFITFYVIRLARFIFSEIARGNITYPGFEQEWAKPTYNIVRFLIICFSFAMIFPYLPGAGSPAFSQISLFVGVLISLGSSGAVSHIIAGVFLTYTGAFRIGDRVKIADTTGDVIEKRLLATRIRTIKNEYITIPNGLVLGSHIINYSASANDTGLILHTSITIGYNVPWETVNKLLIEAALATAEISPEPAPFVLQTSLENSYAMYEINAYTRTPHGMSNIYSHLHENIQKTFNKAGLEIMSPEYSALRDGNMSTVPPEHLAPGYEAPPFKVMVNGTEQSKH